ncbi:hypothetical protein A4A49_07314 [Nicotiana attenuata]|uniref:Uncharacterized protein n=1 Tax=Nicotiana attenuata TaxID=49451 RepID=A0A1J6J5E0_NICAT|nr:hypothetical protein A4A49_07314 [Nicotiana attenuata]
MGQWAQIIKHKEDIPFQDETNFPKVNEMVQWVGGRLWSDQREEDSDAEEVPVGAPVDEEPMYAEQEEEEQSVNGDRIVTINNNTDGNTNKADAEGKDKETNNDNLEATGTDGNYADNAEGIGTNAGDPGGTKVDKNQNTDARNNQQKIAVAGNEVQAKQTQVAQ